MRQRLLAISLFVTRSRSVPVIGRGRGDARILNIFEGAAEIQAQIIARGLVAGRN